MGGPDAALGPDVKMNSAPRPRASFRKAASLSNPGGIRSSWEHHVLLNIPSGAEFDGICSVLRSLFARFVYVGW